MFQHELEPEMPDEEYQRWKERVGESQPPVHTTVTVKYHFKPENPAEGETEK
jgi:hypothetical protein